jgi:hypothetical protein
VVRKDGESAKGDGRVSREEKKLMVGKRLTHTTNGRIVYTATGGEFEWGSFPSLLPSLREQEKTRA